MARYQNSVTLDDTGVVAGSYTNANIVVNAKGQIVAASDGTSGNNGPSGTLDDLVDVNVSTAVTGQVLSFNGSIWQNSDFNLDSLGDVTISTPQAGHVIYFNGSTWINGRASDNNLLSTTDIGTTVQGQNTQLQTLADLSGSAGLLAFNGSTIQKVIIQTPTNGGLSVVNNDGAVSPIQLSIDFNNILMSTALSTDDEILLHDVSADEAMRAKISDVVVAAGAIVDGVNLGSGADIFIIAQNGIAQYRSILSNSPGVVIGTDANDVLVGLSSSLDSLSIADPMAGNFLVGNGTQWASKTTAETKQTLGFGTMADQSASDYLAIAGGTMLGPIDMGGNYSITGLPQPSAPDQVANKDYVDSQVIAGITAGDGLYKNGGTINIGAADSSITVTSDNIALNTTFTDNLYPTKTSLASSILGSEGAELVGTSVKTALGNSTTVEQALAYIEQYFANSLPKFSIDLTAIWNRDVAAPNVNTNTVRDSEVAIFVASDDSAIYADFIIPYQFDTTVPLTFYANVAKTTVDSSGVAFGLAWQYQRPNVAPTNYPLRGPAPNWDFTADVIQNFSNADDLLHTLTWTIPANTFQPLDTVTIRLSRLATDNSDTYMYDVNLFTTLVSQ